MSAESRALVADVAVALQAVVDAHYEPEVIAESMARLFGGSSQERAVRLTATLTFVTAECTRVMYGVPKDREVVFTTMRQDTETGEYTMADLPPLEDLDEGARAAVNAARMIAAAARGDTVTVAAIADTAAEHGGQRAVAGINLQMIQLLHGAEHSSGVVPSFIERSLT